MFTFGNGGIVVLNGFEFCVNSVQMILVNVCDVDGISVRVIGLITVFKIN